MAAKKPTVKKKAAPKRGRPSNAEKAAQEVEIADRRARVASLALTYVPQNQIARQLGVSPATVSTDLKAIKEGWLSGAKSDIQVRAVQELQSIDRLETSLWAQFLSQEQITVRHYNDEGQVIREMLVDKVSVAERTRTALAILQAKGRRAKMLGFDSPELLEVTITPERLIAMRDDLRAELGYSGPKAIEA